MLEINKIYNGDCLELTKLLPDKSINCVITSPPYYQLRNYGFDGQWGLEKNYNDYLDKLIELMKELKRVITDDGTMFINLGDTYGTVSGNMSNPIPSKESNYAGESIHVKQSKNVHKCLMLIPHRFAIRCCDEVGLILRNDIIWAKRNALPESVTDRFSKKHEYIFFFTKNPNYYFDLNSIRDAFAKSSVARLNQDIEHQVGTTRANGGKHKGNMKAVGNAERGKNPGDVSDFWDISTKSTKLKHYATFNFELIDKPIIAGCPENGVILDPFAGSGTTLVRGIQLGRSVIGFDGNSEYCEISKDRIKQEINNRKFI